MVLYAIPFRERPLFRAIFIIQTSFIFILTDLLTVHLDIEDMIINVQREIMNLILSVRPCVCVCLSKLSCLKRLTFECSKR